MLLALAILPTACSIQASTSVRSGVDEAPQLIKNTFLTVARQAATLADYEATSDQWMDFARQVCEGGFVSAEELSEFVADRAGPSADQAVTQMWSTAASAATSAFCPTGRG